MLKFLFLCCLTIRVSTESRSAAKGHKDALDKETPPKLASSRRRAGVDDSILNVMAGTVEQVKMPVYSARSSHGRHCKAGCYSIPPKILNKITILGNSRNLGKKIPCRVAKKNVREAIKAFKIACGRGKEVQKVKHRKAEKGGPRVASKNQHKKPKPKTEDKSKRRAPSKRRKKDVKRRLPPTEKRDLQKTWKRGRSPVGHSPRPHTKHHRPDARNHTGRVGGDLTRRKTRRGRRYTTRKIRNHSAVRNSARLPYSLSTARKMEDPSDDTQEKHTNKLSSRRILARLADEAYTRKVARDTKRKAVLRKALDAASEHKAARRGAGPG